MDLENADIRPAAPEGRDGVRSVVRDPFRRPRRVVREPRYVDVPGAELVIEAVRRGGQQRQDEREEVHGTILEQERLHVTSHFMTL